MDHRSGYRGYFDCSISCCHQAANLLKLRAQSQVWEFPLHGTSFPVDYDKLLLEKLEEKLAVRFYILSSSNLPTIEQVTHMNMTKEANKSDSKSIKKFDDSAFTPFANLPILI